jgi:hypothetical protein
MLDAALSYHYAKEQGDENAEALHPELFTGEGEGGGNKKSFEPIPLPDYNSPTSRFNYLRQWAKRYGDLQGRGDTILKINETPRGGSDTSGNLAIKIGNQFGIDPALLHASAMEEGMSELFKDKSGLDTKHRKPTDFGYMGNYGDKDFPINGPNSMGMSNFSDWFPELVEGGYLPKSFQDRFRGKKRAGEYGENNFKTLDDALMAKAAMMKYGYDYVEKLAAQKQIQLSPAAKDFFMLAFFNGGKGGVLRRLSPYAEKGLLKDDAFLSQRPAQEESVKDTKDDVWGHVVRRIQMRDNLKKEGLF